MVYATIRNGSKGSDVKTLQTYLINAGYNVGSTGADGIFGSKTQAAVKQYQKDNGLVVDGIVGKNTWGSLNAKNTPSTPTTKSNKNAPSTPTFDGVDQKYVDIAYQEYVPSEEEKKYLSQRDEYGESLENKINAGPQFSPEVQQAFDWLYQQQDYFKNGKTSWDDKIYGQISEIENREKFSYDVDNDQLFQQALASAMNSGKTAMEDTIGQASSLTGGYGSTYATSAGNQAYNSFIEDAYDNLPQYYQMALSAYQQEGEEMYNLLGMYTQMGEQEWNRNVDAYNTVFDYASSQRDFEYKSYQDDISNTHDLMNMYDSFYKQKNAEGLTKWQQDIDNAWKTIAQQSSDYQFEINQNNRNEEFGLKQKEYKISTGDTNMDGVLSPDEIAKMNTTYSYDSNGNVVKGEKKGAEYKAPTQSQKQDALEAYNSGGEDAYYQYLDGLPNNIDVEEIDMYVMGDDENKGYGQLPYSQRTYTVVDDGGTNWLWGIDNNAKVKDQYGNVYTLKELNKYAPDVAKELSKKSYTKGTTYTAKK